MKTKGLIGTLAAIFMAVFFNSIVGGVISFAFGFEPVIGMVVWNGVALIAPTFNIYHYLTTGELAPVHTGLALEGLNQEIWIDRLLIKAKESATFLEDGEDMSELVDMDKINMAEEGDEPNTEINRTDYPIPMAPRNDTPRAVELDEFSTDTTIVQDWEAAELSYPKLDSVNKAHVRSIEKKFGRYTLHNWAPTQESANTPVLVTTGADNGFGLKKLIAGDIARHAAQYDALDLPDEGRTIVMDSQTLWEFVSSDPVLLAQYGQMVRQAGEVSGALFTYFGFRIRKFNATPLYRQVNGIWVKQAFGAEATGSDFKGAISYVAKYSIMKAYGSVKMYSKIDDPDYQGTAINYRVRATGKATRQYAIGAIVKVSV